MADSTLHNLTEETTPASTMEVYGVKSPFGSGDDRRVTLANLGKGITAGAILQIIHGYTETMVADSGATFVDSNLTATITPQAVANKILVLMSQGFYISNANTLGWLRLLRDAVTLKDFGFASGYNPGGALITYFPGSYLDSPASVAALVYKTQFNKAVGSATISANYGDANGQIHSTITLMEIKG